MPWGMFQKFLEVDDGGLRLFHAQVKTARLEFLFGHAVHEEVVIVVDGVAERGIRVVREVALKILHGGCRVGFVTVKKIIFMILINF